MMFVSFKHKLVFSQYKPINCLFLSILLSAFSAIFSDIPYSYKKAAVVMMILILPLYFSAIIIGMFIKKDVTIINLIRRAIKVMCAIQLLWIPVQYIAYKFFDVDINQKIFVDFLGCVDNATFIRDWNWYPSGLSWHSAVLAPTFVISLVLFENVYFRSLIVFDSIICGNSTSIIGVAFCGILLIYFNLNKTKALIKIKEQKVVIFGILGMIVIAIFYKLGIMNVIIDRILHLYYRLFATQKDASTAAHFAYFTDYANVWKESTLIQKIFGYGYGCSGYPYSVMYDRYTSLANWAVECDVIDILVSRGWFGFVAHYYFLIKICLSGRKIDYKYCAIIIPIIIQGFGYNVQWDYVFLIEMIMYITIKLKINFFE